MIANAQAADRRVSQAISSTSVSSFLEAIARIAVAQICRRAGFRSAERSALDSLSDVASLYIRQVADFARLHAEASGRTNCNLVDVALAIENLVSCRGFAGASDPGLPIARSGVLGEIISYVSLADETPFQNHIPRRIVWEKVAAVPNFSVLGVKPPFRHVPKWLPAFPEGFESMKETKVEESTVRDCPVAVVALTNGGISSGSSQSFLPSERKKVRFEFGIRENPLDGCLGGFDSGKRKSWLGKISVRRVKGRMNLRETDKDNVVL